jgi:glycosyltransferase involved in cell wall biosynthesis
MKMKEYRMSAPAVTVIADADNASAAIVSGALRATGLETNIVMTKALQGAELAPVVCVSRVCSPEFSWLPDYLVRHNGYTYVLDDHLFAVDPIQDPRAARVFGHPAAQACLEKFLRLARCVVARSETLAIELRHRFPNARIEVLAAPVDWALFERLRVGAPRVSRSDDSLCVGYPTTTRAHLSGLITSIVERSIQRFGNRIRFEFVGWWPPEVARMGGVLCIPGVRGYDNYAQLVMSRGWDAAIAPMGDSVFENCKTPLKYLEYSAMGIPGVYSDTPVYASAVRHGETGLLAANEPGAWIAALEQLLESPAGRAALAVQAGLDVKRDANMRRVGEALRAILVGA